MHPANRSTQASATDTGGASLVGSLPSAHLEDRVASVDALRGLVILLMIFVNDVAGVVGLRLDFYKDPSLPVFVSVLGCLAMAFAIVGLTGLIGRLGLRMKI